jgi:hypothetical protein
MEIRQQEERSASRLLLQPLKLPTGNSDRASGCLPHVQEHHKFCPDAGVVWAYARSLALNASAI